MDARIILGGRGPDVLGAMQSGNALAQQTFDMQRQGDMARLYREQGAGIASGDETAINALAGIDPMAALGVQRDRLNMDIARRNDSRADQQLQMQQQRYARADANDDREWAFRMQEHARGLSAEQAAAQAQQIEEAVRMGMGIPDAATWDQMMAQQAPELVGQFGQRDMLARRYMSMADILKQQAGPAFRAATPEEAQQYGAQAGQFSQDGRFYPINPPSGMSVETGPDGQVRVVQGAGVGAGGARPFTEGQGKDNVYATRAEGALADLEPIASALVDPIQRAANLDPTGVVRGNVQSDDFQRAQNASQDFLMAILRKDTGAAITAEEERLYGRTYLPQPGDNEAVLQQKQVARRRALEALKAGMSADQMVAQERALSASGSTRLDSPEAPPQISTPEAYQALPSGAQFVAPDGTVRRKP